MQASVCDLVPEPTHVKGSLLNSPCVFTFEIMKMFYITGERGSETVAILQEMYLLPCGHPRLIPRIGDRGIYVHDICMLEMSPLLVVTAFSQWWKCDGFASSSGLVLVV